MAGSHSNRHTSLREGRVRGARPVALARPKAQSLLTSSIKREMSIILKLKVTVEDGVDENDALAAWGDYIISVKGDSKLRCSQVTSVCRWLAAGGRWVVRLAARRGRQSARRGRRPRRRRTRAQLSGQVCHRRRP
eukprot:2378296-Prymnesium_polylepis.1